jgi:C1A family cysteine protease
MKFLFLLSAVAFVAAKLSGDLDTELAEWTDYKQTYNRQYSASEEVKRFGCFRTNLKIIDSLNEKGSGATYGLNAFTDLCADEFKIYHNLRVPQNRTVKKAPFVYSPQQVSAAPTSIDWRQHGAVTHVKNQGMCGSCWSFSATGNMEGQYFRKTGTLVALSEEELVQCSSANGNMGCNGGLMDNAFDWVVSNNGIDSEKDYPYTSGGGNTGRCDKLKLKKDAATGFKNHYDLPNDEGQMATWVASNGPLAIAVDASSGWQSYSGGIMSDCDGSQLDHGVLIVGYAPGYWIVKNSWGTGWGENGYIRLQRGTNQCGLNQMPSTITY